MRAICFVVSGALFLAGCGAPYMQLPPGASAVYFDAQTALRLGHNERAIESFTAYLQETDNQAFRPRAYYQLAQAQYATKRYEAALTTLDELKAEFPDQSWPQVDGLRGDIQYALGDPTSAILTWEKAWEIGNDQDRAVLQPRLERAMSELNAVETMELRDEIVVAEIQAMLPPDLTALREDVPPPTVGEDGTQVAMAPDAMAYASDGTMLGPPPEPSGVEYDSSGDTLAALPPLDESGEQHAPAPDATGDMPVWGSAARVGAILSLTGPDRDEGQRALQSLRLAFSDTPSSLVVRDTGGDLALTARLFDQLVSDPTVLAVIGPQKADEAKIVTPLAQKFGMPLLLLSDKQELAGGTVMQFATTPQQETQALVQYARDVLLATRFAVLYPDNQLGRGLDLHFEQEVNRQGGTIVGSKSYMPGQRSFTGEVAALNGWAVKKGVEAVFIPDDAASATQLASAIRRDIPELFLLGAGGWNDPAMIAEAGSSVEGAVFVDSFLPKGGAPSSQGFATRFTEYTGQAPGVTEAQAFDAAMLVRRVLEQGADTRSAVISELRRVGEYEGAGQVHVGPGGFETELILLRVRDGRIEPIRRAAGAG